MEHLREMRSKAGYTGKQFAEMLGIPYTTFLNYERSEREPSINTMKKISKILHCSIDELVGNEKEEK